MVEAVVAVNTAFTPARHIHKIRMNGQIHRRSRHFGDVSMPVTRSRDVSRSRGKQAVERVGCLEARWTKEEMACFQNRTFSRVNL